MGVLRTLGWLATVVYSSIPLFWLMVHPRADYWRERKRTGRAAYQLLGPLWVAVWVVLGVLTWPWRLVILYTSTWAWLPAATLFVGGAVLYSSAKQDFTRQHLIGQPEIESDRDQRLVIQGIRRHVRHPIYLGHFCELLGWSIGTGMLVIWVLTAFAAITGAVMIRMEDDELERRFGEEFRRYREHVPAIFPMHKRAARRSSVV